MKDRKKEYEQQERSNARTGTIVSIVLGVFTFGVRVWADFGPPIDVHRLLTGPLYYALPAALAALWIFSYFYTEADRLKVILVVTAPWIFLLFAPLHFCKHIGPASAPAHHGDETGRDVCMFSSRVHYSGAPDLLTMDWVAVGVFCFVCILSVLWARRIVRPREDY